MADWASEKAREWLQQESNVHDEVPLTASVQSSLAALLREVEETARRLVAEESACDEMLSRLEKS